MASEQIIRVVGKQLNEYFQKKRLEDGFDISGPSNPALDHPNIKQSTLINVPGLYERPVKNYFSSPQDVSEDERKQVVQKLVERYVKHYGYTEFKKRKISVNKKPIPRLPYECYIQTRHGLKLKANYRDILMSKYAHKPIPKKPKIRPIYGSFPMVRVAPNPIISKGEAERLVNMATRVLCSNEKVDLEPRDPSPKADSSSELTKPEGKMISRASKDKQKEEEPTKQVGHFKIGNRRRDKERGISTSNNSKARTKSSSVEETDTTEPTTTTDDQSNASAGGRQFPRWLSQELARYSSHSHPLVEDEGDHSRQETTTSKDQTNSSAYAAGNSKRRKERRNEQDQFVLYHHYPPRPPASSDRRPKRPESAGEKVGDSEQVRPRRSVRMRSAGPRSELSTAATQTDRQLLLEYDRTAHVVSDGKEMQYVVEVQTGDCLGASTKAPVFLRLYGELGCSTEIALLDSWTHKVLFLKGNVDKFKLTCCHVGKLEKVQIGHNSTNPASSWFLESVTIEDSEDKRRYQFPCKKWLSVQAPDGQTKRFLFPSSVVDIEESVEHAEGSEDDMEEVVQQVLSRDSSRHSSVDQSRSPSATRSRSSSDQSDTRDAERGSYTSSYSSIESESERESESEESEDDEPVVVEIESDQEDRQKEKVGDVQSIEEEYSSKPSVNKALKRESFSSHNEEEDIPVFGRPRSPDSKASMKVDDKTKDRADEKRDIFGVDEPKKKESVPDPKRDIFSEEKSQTSSMIVQASGRAQRSSSSSRESSSSGSSSYESERGRSSRAEADQMGSPVARVEDDRAVEVDMARAPASKLSGRFVTAKRRSDPRTDDVDERMEEDEKVERSDTESRVTPEHSLLKGKTIHQAVVQGDLNRVIELVTNNPKDLTQPDENGLHPMHLATQYGRTEVIRWLWRTGARLNPETPTGYQPVHLAALHGRVDSLDTLKTLGASIATTTTLDNMTPLHLAASKGHLSTVKWLVENGADPEPVDVSWRTPLELAEQYRHTSVVDYLRQKLGLPEGSVSEESQVQEHEAFKVSERGAEEKEDERTNASAEINRKRKEEEKSDTDSGVTPEHALLKGKTIHQAVVQGDLYRVKELVTNNPKDLTQPDEHGLHPMHLASQHGQTEVIRWLWRTGTRLDSETPTDYLPVHLAALHGQADSLDTLKTLGASIATTTTLSNMTPLHLAASKGHVGTVKWLIENGADPEPVDVSWRTPLELAQMYRQMEVVRYLRQRLGLPEESVSEEDQEQQEKNGEEEALRDSKSAAEEKKRAELNEKRKLYAKQQATLKSENISFLDQIRHEMMGEQSENQDDTEEGDSLSSSSYDETSEEESDSKVRNL